MVFFPAILFPASGGEPAGCVVPGPNINAGGDDDAAALNDAVEVLQALFAEADAAGEPRPQPATLAAAQAEIAALGGQLVWLPALDPAEAA